MSRVSAPELSRVEVIVVTVVPIQIPPLLWMPAVSSLEQKRAAVGRGRSLPLLCVRPCPFFLPPRPPLPHRTRLFSQPQTRAKNRKGGVEGLGGDDKRVPEADSGVPVHSHYRSLLFPPDMSSLTDSVVTHDECKEEPITVTLFDDVVRACTRLCDVACIWVFNYISLPTDTADDERRKKTLLTVVVSFMIFPLATMWSWRGDSWNFVASVLYIGAAIPCLAYVLYTKSCSARFCEMWCVGISLGIIPLSDLDALVNMTGRWWPLWILCLDMILFLNLSDRTAAVIIVIAISWLILVQLHMVVDVGLISNPFAESSIPQVCECEHPPCPGKSLVRALSSAITALLIFLLDFMLTRSFAVRMRRECGHMKASAEGAAHIASCLAVFDLDSAGRALEAEEGVRMPSEMRVSLRTILGHLQRYRPYLPQAILQEAQGDRAGTATSEDVRPPGEGQAQPQVAIVFTDIVGSTLLWERCYEGMCKAMEVHNTAVREAVAQRGGYEVKTIGDAFMVAFESPATAVLFGLDVQTLLREAPWPEKLTCGLEVRIGVHYGAVTMAVNQLTERMDYFGPTVNRAARLEGVALPGEIALLQDLWVESEGLHSSLPAGVTERHVGVRELSGVPGKFSIVALSHALDSVTLLCVGGGDSTVASSGAVSHSSSHVKSGVHIDYHNASASRCSIAEVRFHLPAAAPEEWGCVKEHFLLLVTCLRRSGGHVASVAGLCVLCGWGLLKEQKQHAAKAFEFAALLQRTIRAEARNGVAHAGRPVDLQPPLACGLSTGTVCGGHVGDWEARFLAYGGQAVQLCGALCALAHDLGADVLYAAATGEVPAMLGPALRPVGYVHEKWGTVVAHEVSGRRLPREMTEDEFWSSDDEGSECEEWGWSAGYSASFHRRDMGAIREWAEHDMVLQNTCRLLRSAVESGERAVVVEQDNERVFETAGPPLSAASKHV